MSGHPWQEPGLTAGERMWAVLQSAEFLQSGIREALEAHAADAVRRAEIAAVAESACKEMAARLVAAQDILDALRARAEAAEAQAAALQEALHYLAMISTDGSEQWCQLCGRASRPGEESHEPECGLALDAGRALLAELATLHEVAEAARHAVVQARGSIMIDAMVDDDGKPYGTTTVALEALDRLAAALAKLPEAPDGV